MLWVASVTALMPSIIAALLHSCEPVSGTSKRKLDNGEQRLRPENHRPGTKSFKIARLGHARFRSRHRCLSTRFVAVYSRLNFHRTVRREPERASKNGHG